jgi:hypothetical protein
MGQNLEQSVIWDNTFKVRQQRMNNSFHMNKIVDVLCEGGFSGTKP